MHPMPYGAQLEGNAVRFALWAPAAHSVAVELDDELLVPLDACDGGWFRTVTTAARSGSRYRFLIDNADAVPDPASRFQPDGVHGASEVVDPRAYIWSSRPWRPPAWHELIFYELHVGTFTPAGTYRAAIERLDDLVALGITAIELMPLAESPGQRNWGYDGAYPFAPESGYGRPEDLKALVEAAHERGLAVFLDVVYNHFGPEGNYLHRYAPQFFTERHRTPWGSAIGFEGPAEMRRFFVHNALYWTQEFGFDGLRLDAVHAIFDDVHRGVLTHIAEALVAAGNATSDGRAYAVLENDRNSAQLLRWFGAQWDDDVHHALHVLMTKETHGYYADYSSSAVRLLARALTEGFAYQGEPSVFRDGTPRGEPSASLQPTSFVTFLQNHDQVGNRSSGERIGLLAGTDKQRSAAALLLLAPSLPLLFMGEEWAASSPFLFFCDFEPALAALVREARKRDFADPGLEDAFERSKLRWSERVDEPHRSMLAWYTTLLALRREAIVPLLARRRISVASRCSERGSALGARWTFEGGASLAVVANFEDEALDSAPLSEFIGTSKEGLLETPARGRPERETHLPPWSVSWSLRR